MTQLTSVVFPAKRQRPVWQYLIIPTAVFLLLLTYHPLRMGSVLLPYDKPTAKPPSATEHLKSERLHDYWTQLRDALATHRPAVPPVNVTGPPIPEEALDPNKVDSDSPRPSLVDMDEGDLETLQALHFSFITSLKTLAPSLPTWKGSRGVVMTAGGGYLGMAMTSILMLRRSGSVLPVHLFLDTLAERDPDLCDTVLPALNVECLVMEDLLRGGHGAAAAEVEHFQYKVLAMLLSPFEQILYLDSDAWPIRAPDRLFDSAPFTSHGLVAWPDFWLGTASPLYYRIAGLAPPRILARRSSESGILLYDKATHAESLLLAAYYNWYGPRWYYPLLSQGAHGEGDKETFVQAALALGQPFWDVRTPVTVLGRWVNGTFETSGMKQADPAEDHGLFGAAAAAAPDADHAREEPDEGKRMRARPLFIHHNLFKVSLGAVGGPHDPMFRADADGRLARLWGPDRGLVESSGFDVERAMWDVVLAADCGSTSSGPDECDRLKQWYRTVFIEAPPLIPES
ncbi:hypothetical protein EsH8_VI_000273 [Colletotrichum jinshuiense]